MENTICVMNNSLRCCLVLLLFSCLLLMTGCCSVSKTDREIYQSCEKLMAAEGINPQSILVHEPVEGGYFLLLKDGNHIQCFDVRETNGTWYIATRGEKIADLTWTRNDNPAETVFTSNGTEMRIVIGKNEKMPQESQTQWNEEYAIYYEMQ